MDNVERPPKDQGDRKSQHNASRYKFKNKNENFTPTKPLLLFDLNGVLVKHFYSAVPKQVSKRHKFVVRPGIHHLARLHGVFDIGIYSSSTQNTVEMALREIGSHVKLNLCKILHRRDCAPASAAFKKWPVVDTGRARQVKPWDTFKPLKNHFQDLSSVALIDDSPYKSFPGEEESMIVIPAFHPPSISLDKDYYAGEGDGVLQLLVDSILSSFTEQKVFGNAVALVRNIFDGLNDFVAKEVWSTMIGIMGSGQPVRADLAGKQQALHCQLVLPGDMKVRGLLVRGSSEQSGEHHDEQTQGWIWVRIVDIFIPDQVAICEEISQHAESHSKHSLEKNFVGLSLQ